MTPQQIKAQQALNEMKVSLQSWLHYRQEMDKAAEAGSTSARSFINAYRDHDLELRLANDLHALLHRLHPEADLPSPTSFDAASQLANIAISGPKPTGPETVGFLPFFPLMVASFVVLTWFIYTAIRLRHMAAMAAEKERLAVCRETGRACPTDWGQVAFWGAALMGGFYFVTQTDMGRTLRKKVGI